MIHVLIHTMKGCGRHPLVQCKCMHISDREIRSSLHSNISKEKFFLDDPNCLLMDELGLCQGSARIDVAVLNGRIHGYEIKSDLDTLERLESQLTVYEKIFDKLTLVVGKKHLPLIADRIPEWCGIILARLDKGKVSLKSIRAGRLNKNIDPYSLVQLLWKDEAIAILRERGDTQVLANKPRAVAWKRLVDTTSRTELRTYVRETLKTRPIRSNWRQPAIVQE